MHNKRVRYKFEERRYTFSGSTEVEMQRTGKPPDRGKRKKREKPTEEQIRKRNQYNKEKHVRRLIKQNFQENDYWITLTYVRGHRSDVGAAVADRKKFLDLLRAWYRKQGYDLKWIGRTEVGKRGAIHHHLILNRIPDADLVVSKFWKKIKNAGRADFVLMYEKGQYKELAAYLVKPDQEDEAGNPVTASSYSHSRGNLVVPQPEVRRTTLRKISEYPQPSPGYYIDKDSVSMGRNPVTGREYLHYIEIRLKGGGG